MSKNSIQSKIESITKPQKQEVIITKPKKLDSSILDKIEKKGTVNNPMLKRNLIKEKEQQEFEKIENMSTFDKILKLQNLLKEITSMKVRFETNKDQILTNINKNTFKYYESKINMKEIYDYCQSDNLEEYIKYTLIADPFPYFDEKGKDLYKDIYNFLFLIRNNNKMMLKLIEKSDKEDYENLSDFLVNFCYEDTINSSFIQEELMLLIYLILEKNMMNLPKEILNNDNNASYNIFRNDENLVYHLLRSLSRKADIRNFLCSILLDAINNIQELRKNLNLDIDYKPKNSINNEDNSDNPLNNSYDNITPDKFEKINVVHRHYTIRKKNPENKLRLSNAKNDETIIRNQTNNDIENPKENKNEEDKKIENDKIDLEKINQVNENKDIFSIPDNITEEELKKIKIDSFFENNDVSLNYLQKKLKDINNISKNTKINSSMKDYLELLIKDIKNEKDEVYSDKKLINYLKLMKINDAKEVNQNNSPENLDEKINNLKSNYNIIIKSIDDIIVKINENITKVPVIIKCISNVIEQLLNKKYIERKPTKLISNYQKYIFKSNFFYGNFVLCSLSNLDYNGIFFSDIISSTTLENLNIIINILNKMLSGKLFTNCYEVIYNKYIIETLPKFFEVIDNIEKNFKLPDVLQRLVNTCTDTKNKKRLQDFEYDYFFEKNEEIQYQSLCFNFDNLLVFMKLAKKNIESLNNYSEDEKQIIGKIYGYETFLADINKQNKIKEKRCDFIYLVKINFNSKTEKKINSILRDNFASVNPGQNSNNVQFLKKCLVEVLEYANVINKYNFRYFIQNLKTKIRNHDINHMLFRKNRFLNYENIVNGKNIHLNINEDEYMEKSLNFRNELFHNILEFLKVEIGTNYNDSKTQRIVFCAFYVQTNLKLLPDEYKENNYGKLIIELIKEAMEKLNYLNSSILNQLYNKIKEGNKLNLIITSNYLQVKSLEKFKCIEYLYYKSLLPLQFKIEKDENNIIKKVEYLSTDETTKKEENNEKPQDIVIMLNDTEKIADTKKTKKQLKPSFPNFRKYEDKIDDIVKLEEDCLMADALKEYFLKLKKVVKAEKIIKRFSKDEIDSILIELENHILYKLYDKLYPIKSTKLDDEFYKKCCRLEFIKPENIITDKNIYNERLWQFSMDYLNEINSKYTPQDKLKVVLKSFGILQNSITFCSGKKELGVDDTIKPLIYVLIKSKPKTIFTNYNYCQLFLNDNLCKTQYGILLTQLYMIMNIIKDMKHSDLIGVTEEQFGKDE